MATHGVLALVAALGDGASWRPWAFVAALGAAFAAWFHAWRRLSRIERALGSRASIGTAGILLVAAVVRILLLPVPPVLSDDVYRYVWDGRATTAGFNPYRLAPDAPELSALRADHPWPVPHGDVPTVYPPLALGAFSIAALTPAPFLLLKALTAAADLATCALLLVLAGRLGLPRSRVVLYAWNPLVVIETAGMGHVDGLAVVGAVAAVVFLLTRPPRPGTAGVAGAAAALGILAKLGPLAALPAWSRRVWRDTGPKGLAAFAAALGLLLGVAGLPVLASVGGVPPGLVTYGVDWEWNGPLYEPLWRGLAAVDAAGWAKRGLDAVKQATEQWDRFNVLYPWLYPQSLAKALLGLGMVWVVARSVVGTRPERGRDRERETERGVERTEMIVVTGRLFGGLLLLSATLYPWYLLWVLPWAALGRHRAWLALSGLVPLSYLPQLVPSGELALWPWVFLLIWLPFWALWPGSRWSIS